MRPSLWLLGETMWVTRKYRSCRKENVGFQKKKLTKKNDEIEKKIDQGTKREREWTIKRKKLVMRKEM